MDEIKLNTFLTVVECGSFTKAADELFLSPISVKKQIDSLETELGEPLFIRRATGCTLTEVGSIFEKHAVKIIEAIEEARSDVESNAIKSRGEIIAGHSITFNYRFVGALSTAFFETHSNCVIQFQKYPRNELINLLENHKINCIFAESTLLDDSKPEIEFHPLASLPVYAIMSKTHPLASRSSLSISDLAGYQLYSTIALSNQTLSMLHDISNGKQEYIENTDRNVLFNSIIRGDIEIYPREFNYYRCIPLDVPPIVIGIYTMKTIPEITRNMISFTTRFVQNNNLMADEIM